MDLIFTGPKHDAVALRRCLREAGVEAVVMTADDHPDGAVFVTTDNAKDLRPTSARAIERMEIERDAEGDGPDESTLKRAPDELYWRAYTEMRAAHARIQPFEEADPPFDSEDVEWACAEGLARLGQVMRAIQDLAPGHCRIAVEGATERAGALLLGMRAIALVLASPLADDRGEIRTDNVDWPAHSAIGFLLALLDELTPERAPVKWMREDARGRLPGNSDDANGAAVWTPPRS